MGFGNKKSVPDWVREAPPGVFQTGIRERLPFWMRSHTKEWNLISGALVTAPREWVYADELENRDPSLAAQVRLKLEETLRGIKVVDLLWAWTQKEVLPWDRTHNPSAVRPWGEEHLKHFLDGCPNLLSLPLPNDIGFQYATNGTERPERPWAFAIGTHDYSLAKIRFRILVGGSEDSKSRFVSSKKVLADPTTPGEMTYWAAVVQTVTSTELVVLKSTEQVELGYGGPATLWAWGTEVDVTLPVPAIRIDPTWEQLPRMITYCQQSGLLYEAHRERQSVRTPLD